MNKLFGLAALLAFVSTAGVLAAAPARPNIIVILADDVGFSDVGCYGSEIQTPALDKLAADGLRYSQFYNTARCCPTRASLLTGLYPHQAGVGHMTDNRGVDGYRGELNDRCVTMAQVLRSAGYGTYGVGKWHIANNANTKPDGNKNAWPLQRGFDRFYGTITGAGNYFDPGALTRDNTMISAKADPLYQPKTYYYTDAISDHAVQFVTDHHKATPEKPFFMYVAYTAAHWPMQALPEDIAKYKGKYDAGYNPIREARLKKMQSLGLIDSRWQIPAAIGDWEKMEQKEWEARCMEVYAAMIDRMDRGIGKLVESLRQQGQFENTLILYMQDNGACAENIGRQGKPTPPQTFPKIDDSVVRLNDVRKQTRDGRAMRQGVGVMPGTEDTFIAYGEAWANVSNTPFRLYKHYTHEGGISTPLIASWPKGISRKGDWEKQPSHLIDIMATVVDLAGATYPQEFNGKPITPMEGRSLTPTFEGKAIDRDAIYWEHEGNRAVRAGKWKLVAKGYQGRWELYDIEADRTETQNLADKQPEKTKELAAKWDAYAKRANVLPYPAANSEPVAASKAKSFNLKSGADLDGTDNPDTGKKPFTITVDISKPGKEGVLMAQGGTAHGFTLYVKQSKLVFAARHQNKLTEIASPQPLPNQPVKVKVVLAAGGGVTLYADDKELTSGKMPGLLVRTPADGLQVGSDLNASVGNYESPFSFDGEISGATLELAGKK